ncbi:uncharacterized protein N7458_005001 [Penicillium daleae]|uniref:ERT1/acuK family PAS domain-containing protein n=1 Tax=Penicillium daleae TaxID=63821 RepID=A0AAD6G4D3_9EURO|nr:uncharacterized protein N7458_005001 [Penicillium daleae]KAJ5454045.1 hypothetical protein N7458_005001 [Penicillium daleae]
MTEKIESGTGSKKSTAAMSMASAGDAGKNAHAKESQAASVAQSETAGTDSHSSPKKRRKVNLGKMLVAQYACNRVLGTFSGHRFACCKPEDEPADQFQFVKERPCTRCIKRNIGHLCHDEPRVPPKRTRSEHDRSAVDEEGSSNNEPVTVRGMSRRVDVRDAAGQQILPDGTIGSSASSVQPGNIPSSDQGLDANSQWLMAYNDWLGGQNQFQDMHWLRQSYMFNAPEVTNEYNLLGDFLSNSLHNDRAMFQNQDIQGIYSDPSLINSTSTLRESHGRPQTQPPPPAHSQAPQSDSIQRLTPTLGNNQARETYYMTAADPSGSDPPEERMNKLLKAKYDAGLLKPFNYVKGYARLNEYMEKNMQHTSRQRILRQLDKFRPKFRELMHSLTDVELILVEMWFEQSLMEYDRVFASMAIPACCWRRTGEVFRGNNEMAQLIDVPVESLRDGKLAIHEIIAEDQLVNYWEKFGAIAFDNTQKAILTSCTLKSPTHSAGEAIPCCFSFTIRRDNHDIPSLIVGNFLPT